MPLLINAERFRADFDALARIGSTGDGGVNRPALSPAHLEARRWFLARATAAGLDTQVDSAGNHSAILRARAGGPRRSLLLGSHLDSVHNGGRFDGALGVLAALEVLRSAQEAGLDLPVDLDRRGISKPSPDRRQRLELPLVESAIQRVVDVSPGGEGDADRGKRGDHRCGLRALDGAPQCLSDEHDDDGVRRHNECR